MNKFQEQVKEFHETFDVPVHDKPLCSIAKERALLRARLIFEEAIETIVAMNCNINVDYDRNVHIVVQKSDFNMVEVADGLADLTYVIMGAALEFGIDLEPVFNEVHRSNMSKAWTEEEIKDLPQGWTATPVDGLLVSYCVKDEVGKVRKSPGYSKADIRKVLDRLMEGK